ncbi:contact-dependent growth inhibition system immunity protein [Microbulbifer sp. CNSA002]|uniref:contact-dependent growth inhibition system immunity protein n=1 Tax=Microbulbifer sp. CNSA002 TaxID=3373604 RepID=UPI0039B6CD8F
MLTSRSLEELEGSIQSSVFQSHLAVKCQRLYKLPLCDLSVENLRMLVGQKLGLKYTVPLALDMLEQNPMVSGGMYEGDLLVNVAKLNANFWSSNPELNNRLVEIKIQLETLAETINNELLPIIASMDFK